MCGEHLASSVTGTFNEGSSPRVRGTRAAHDYQSVVRGIIPACAGNTAFDSREIIKARDHPRVCGEHATLRVKLLRVSGSSPRVRGTRRVEREPGGCAGIIPACAGNTTASTRERPSSWDHPRVCGEHDGLNVGMPVKLGSSPRVRGTRHGQASVDIPVGIIPACAGNTSSHQVTELFLRDHPRVCGEHLACTHIRSYVRGSSPRVRGTPQVVDVHRLNGGIIPACAGNTEPIQQGIRAAQGSSPRVRGTLPPIPAVPRRVGIIPACAGNTSASGSSRP